LVDTTDNLARAARDHWVAKKSGNSTFVDYILDKMDLKAMEGSGNIDEMKREVETLIHQYYHAVADSIHNQQQQHTYSSWSWYAWLRTAISRCLTVDWSMGAYLWHTCSGLILVLIVTSIVPGRLHGWTGRALRFPILVMTYMLICGELVMYTLIRFAIRALEGLFANRKHRAWRNGMAQAKTYEEWYEIAKKLDDSQGRLEWQVNVKDDTAYRYSWPFISELLSDLKSSRENNDILMALAVLQQCTRKNVGGIMSDDLFSFTNCGEPKQMVSEFIDEVVKTLEWATEEVRERSRASPPEVVLEVIQESTECQKEELKVDMELKTMVEDEKSKLFGHMISWATLGILGGSGDDYKDKKEKDKEEDESEAGIEDENNDEKKRDNAQDEKTDMVDRVPTEAAISNEEYAKNLIVREKIKTFLKRARAAYGRTAFCLSGGAMMGNYHFGAVKALLETDLLPHIISGTSAGSVIGAMICTRTEEELVRDLKPEVLGLRMSIFESSWGERLGRWYKHGTMFDQDDWYRRVRWFTCGDMTFEEAYKKTGRVFCVTLSATSKKAPPVLINYITAPNVVVASAVLASAAVPGFVDAMRLQVKGEDGLVRDQAKFDEEYRDGSIDSDIPTNGLAEMLNCRFFLAAQANPHIVPFFYNSKGDVGRPSRWSSGVRDDSWRGGFLLSALEMYLKNDMRSKFHFLNDLEVAVGFTSTMMTQTYSGTTTIVPQVCLKDFFLLFDNQSNDDMRRYFQGGAVAAYQHVAMLKHHYKIAHALDECLASLEFDEAPKAPPRRRRSLLYKQKSRIKVASGGGLHFTKLESKNIKMRESNSTSPASTVSEEFMSDDEHEKGGFDGVDCAFGPGRRPSFSEASNDS